MSIVAIPPIIYPMMQGHASSGNTLDATDEFAFAIIRITKTGTLNKIGWRTYIVSGSSYTLKISLETVAETVGQPCATTNATKTLFAAGAESADITSLSTNAFYWTPINGSTGVSVTAGDLICVTWRLTAVSGSSVVVRNGGSSAGADISTSVSNVCYSGTYLGGAWSLTGQMGSLALEYSDGITYNPYTSPPATLNGQAYNSGSTYPYTGINMRFPFKCRLQAMYANLDLDGDAQVILYDSNGYSVMSGFPITIKNTQRRNTSAGFIQVAFPTKPTLEANTDYSLVILPTSTTNITLTSYIYTADGSYSGLDVLPGGDDLVLIQRGTAPSSGDHAWTKSTTDRPHIVVLIDGIEASSGGSGISRSRQLMG